MESVAWNVNSFGHGCVPGGIRTPNLLIRSQLLYPVELQTPLEFSLRHAQGLEPAEQAIFEFRLEEAIEKRPSTRLFG